MKKIIPWVISTILLVALTAVYFQQKAAITTKDIELKNAEEKHLALKTDLEKQLRIAQDKLVEAEQRVSLKTEQLRQVQDEAGAKLADVEQKLSAKNEQISQVKDEASAKIQAVTAESNAKLQIANQPEPTILLGMRKAILGNGLVATVRNSSARTIAVTILASRNGGAQERQFELTLDSGSFKEIGEREGWAFMSGDQVKLSQAGHKTVVKRIN